MTRQLGKVLNWRETWYRPVVVSTHLGLICVSNYLAFLLRFDGAVPYPQAGLVAETLPWLVLVRGLVFVLFRLYEGLWRYASLWDLRNIIAGVGVSSVLFYILVRYGFQENAYFLSIFFIDGILLICFIGGFRLVWRLNREIGLREGRRRVVVYGAGDAGEMIVREMRQNPLYEGEPVGFIDDDWRKVGRRIHGIPVMGTRESLPEVMRTESPDEVLIAIPSASAATIRDIVTVLEAFKVPIKTLPSLRDLIGCRVGVRQIRSLALEDLLTRAPVGIDSGRVRDLITGRRVLVTGAGGSIGSELCRQLAGLQPSRLVLYDRYENGLHAIATELSDNGMGDALPVIGDVTDRGRLDEVLAEHRPEIIFHAAAHKHVPLMEGNPCEAVKNNVTGTRVVAQAAEEHGVRRVIFISTDKAVRPTSVMGATKRVAELLLQRRASHSRTSFSIVRFGNVLASNGSVVPRFLAQIKAGGPLTVTHPDMQRYFMLIQEAVQLVLHAAAQDEATPIYALQMGEQVSVLDLARNLIRLSGLVPDRDIQIVFSGIRPGEKLEEELVGDAELAEPSTVDGVLHVHPGPLPAHQTLRVQVEALEHFASRNDAPGVLRQLRLIVSGCEQDSDSVSTGIVKFRRPQAA
jgi:FlaA1/EpsC-like NDP-sugar epimerase